MNVKISAMKKFVFIFLIFLGLFSFLDFRSVKAIPISPDKYYFDLNTDEEKEFALSILGKENLTTTQTAFIYVLKMQKVGEENDRVFSTPNSADPSDISNWIELSNTQIALNKGDIKQITWKIKNRGAAKCGTNLAAIAISESPPKDQINGNTVAIKNEVITQIHVNIKSGKDGNCDNAKFSTKLIDFKLNSNSNIFNIPQTPFETKIENEGDLINRSPKGFIEIFQGGRKVDTIEFNPTSLDIYPGTTRKFENLWTDNNYPYKGNYFDQLIYELKNPRFGNFEARLGVTKNADPQLTSTVSFWIIPWKIISLILFLALIFGIMFIIFKRQNRKTSRR